MDTGQLDLPLQTQPAEKLSSKIDDWLLKHAKPIDLPEATIPLTHIAHQLAKAGGIQQAFNIKIVNKPSYNAAAFSNGTVIFNLDTLKRAKSPEELAFVLAHELSHVQFEDSKARKKRYGIATTAAYLLEEGSTWVLQGRSLFKSLAISIAAPAVAFQWFAFQERKDEARADINAIRLLNQAGYSPLGYATAFANMSQEKDKVSLWTKIQWKVFGEDHPALPTRQRSVETAIMSNPPILFNRTLMSQDEWQDLKQAAFNIPTRQK
jgi:predicted Zn-dependent protease